MVVRLALVAALVALAYSQSPVDDVTAELKDQSQCNNRILASKGVKKPGPLKTRSGYVQIDRAASFYRKGGQASVVFKEDKLWIESKEGVAKKVKIPGCFILRAKDVQINRPLRTLTAEIDMRIGAIPDRTSKVRDWPKPLPCQQQNINNTCACGLSDSCFYCDFCKNFDNHVKSLDSDKTADIRGRGRGRGNSGNRNIVKPAQKVSVFSQSEQKLIDVNACNCDIQPGLYDIEAEICTPNAETLNKVLPEAVVALVDENRAKAAQGAKRADTEFTLYSIVTLYDDNFNVVSDWKNQPEIVQKGRLFNHRSKHVVGCHFVVTDVVV